MMFHQLSEMVKHWAWNCDPQECREMLATHQFEHNWTTDMVAAEMARQKYPLHQIVQVCLPSAYDILPDGYAQYKVSESKR